jgi:hypothetical protein
MMNYTEFQTSNRYPLVTFLLGAAEGDPGGGSAGGGRRPAKKTAKKATKKPSKKK